MFCNPSLISGLFFTQLGRYNITGTDYERDSRNAVKTLQFLHMRKAELLKAIQSREDTLIVLRNAKLREQFSFLELLNIIDQHRDLAEKLSDSPVFVNFTEDQKMCFGVKHVALARKALTYPNIQIHQRVTIGVFCPEIAFEMLDSAEMAASMSPVHLSILGELNKEVALHIVKRPSLTNRMIAKDLAALGEEHVEVAEYILNTVALFSKFQSLTDLIMLCQKHERLVQRILTPAMRAYLNHDQYAKLGKYLSVAKMKELQFNELMPGFTAQQLLEMGRDNEELAMHILDTPVLCDNLHGHYLADLGANSLKVAKRIFNTPAIFEKVGNHLEQLVQEHEELVMQVLKDESLCNTFEASELAHFAQTHFSAAQTILENPALRDKLSVGHLHTMGMAFPSLVHKILALPITRRMNVVLIEGLTNKAKHFNDICQLFALPTKLQLQPEVQQERLLQDELPVRQIEQTPQPRRSVRIQEREAKKRRLAL